MRRILVCLACSVIVLIFLAFSLPTATCQAQPQVKKLLEQGAGQMKQQQYDQAIATFKKAIEIDPNYWVALINLGTSYYYQGEKAKAAPLFKKALALNPNHPEKAQLEKMIQEGGQKP